MARKRRSGGNVGRVVRVSPCCCLLHRQALIRFRGANIPEGIRDGANVAINSYEYKGGQSGLETNLNIGVNTTSLIVGGTSGIGISVGYEYLKFMWNNILNYGESVHQLFYEKYQNYWKGTEFDPEK